MFEHWLELRAPSGLWSWEGWLTSAPWDGALAGDSRTSTKSTVHTFTDPGEYVIRGTTIDPYSGWVTSNEVHVHVGETRQPTSDETPDDPPPAPAPENPATPPPTPKEPEDPPAPPVENTAPALPIATVAINGIRGAHTAAAGTTLTLSSIATDANGDMLEHWIELWSPEHSWSWEGWLTSAPWLGNLAGNGARSEKSATFTFNNAGNYLVRASAVDTQGQWIISPELTLTITQP
jgi:hypothetical protein